MQAGPSILRLVFLVFVGNDQAVFVIGGGGQNVFLESIFFSVIAQCQEARYALRKKSHSIWKQVSTKMKFNRVSTQWNSIDDNFDF